MPYQSKEAKNAQRNVRKRAVIATINQIKLDRGCACCGYNEYAIALDFHHRDKSTKSDTINYLVNQYAIMMVVMEEIDKCEVLCAICHRLVEAGIKELPVR